MRQYAGFRSSGPDPSRSNTAHPGTTRLSLWQDPSVDNLARGAAGPVNTGKALEHPIRAEMESRFGHDFSRVRVHTDEEAATAARHEWVAAYTIGDDIFFRRRYAPQTAAGRRLLTHELVHVVQQRGPSLGGPVSSDGALRALETEATRLATLSETWPGPLRVRTTLPVGSAAPQFASDAETEVSEDEASTAPDFAATSVIWFQLDSDRPREDREVSSTTHLAIAIRRIRDHAAVAGDTQSIILHGYASREGTEQRNQTLSSMRADFVRRLLVEAGIPEGHITTVAHGPDSTYPQLRWNRRVAIEMTPSVSEIEFAEQEGAEVVGVPPRTGPKPPESTRQVLTPSHRELREQERIGADPVRQWSEQDVLEMLVEQQSKGTSRTLLEYKDGWVHAHRSIIRAAAAQNDLPNWFLAGVAWAEVAGDPPSADYLAYSLRRNLGVGKPAVETSFGAVSVQLRRAAEELGYDPSGLTNLQISFLIASLEDPQQNLFIVASHLDRLRDQDFPGKPGELLTDDDLKVIGARYNRGPDLPLERIRANLSYGENVVKKKARLQQLLVDQGRP